MRSAPPGSDDSTSVAGSAGSGPASSPRWRVERATCNATPQRRGRRPVERSRARHRRRTSDRSAGCRDIVG